MSDNRINGALATVPQTGGSGIVKGKAPRDIGEWFDSLPTAGATTRFSGQSLDGRKFVGKIEGAPRAATMAAVEEFLASAKELSIRESAHAVENGGGLKMAVTKKVTGKALLAYIKGEAAPAKAEDVPALPAPSPNGETVATA